MAPTMNTLGALGGAAYSLTPDEIAKRLGVDPAAGLSSAEAGRRLQEYGPNRLAAKKKESLLHAFRRTAASS